MLQFITVLKIYKDLSFLVFKFDVIKFYKLEYHKKFSKFFHGTQAPWKTQFSQTRVPKKW